MTNTERPASKGKIAGLPPLAWLVIGALLVIGLIALFGNNGVDRPPSGGAAMPIDMPDAPAVPDPAPIPPPATPSPVPG